MINERNDTVTSYRIASSYEKLSYVFTFQDIEKGYYAVNIQGDQPFYVSSFSMFDGNFSENDLKITSIIANITPVEKYLVSGIAENSYRFANLNAKVFQYRVRAEKDEAFSQWTEYDIVKLGDSNGITSNIFNDNIIIRIISNYFFDFIINFISSILN